MLTKIFLKTSLLLPWIFVIGLVGTGLFFSFTEYKKSSVIIPQNNDMSSLPTASKTLWTVTTANLRKCPAFENCPVIGNYPQGTEIIFPNFNPSSEWHEINWSDNGITKKGYIHKSVLQETKPQEYSAPPSFQRPISPLSQSPAQQNSQIPSRITTDEFTLDEIRNISKSVVFIYCSYGSYGSVTGSGSYLKNGQVLTNAHVLINEKLILASRSGPTNCLVQFPDFESGLAAGGYNLSLENAKGTLEDNLDVGIATLGAQIAGQTLNLSERALKLNICDGSIPEGTKVFIFGYPSSAAGTPIVTEGIISGKKGILFYDKTGVLRNTYDYYVSAKIDAGNSGGVAAIKRNGAACFVGLPTWVNDGVHDSLGIVQSFEHMRAMFDF